MTTHKIREDVFPARVFVLPPEAEPTDPSVKHPKHYVPTGAVMLTDRARVVITLDAVFIYKDSPSGPVLVMTTRLDDIIGNRQTGLRLVMSSAPDVADPRTTGLDFPPEALALTSPSTTETPSGDLVIVRDPHCGCGSRLRSLRPLEGAAYTSIPRTQP